MVSEQPVGNDSNRKLVVGMALATGAAGWIPVPLASSWAVTTLRRLLLQQLARRHDVTFDRGVVQIVAGDAGPSVGTLALDAAKAAAFRDMKTLLRTLPLLIRFGDIVRTLVLGSYFERYCSEHHRPGTIDLDRARRLRQALDAAGEKAVVGALGGLLRHVAGEVGRLALATPRALWELLTEALARGDEAAEKVIESDGAGLFARATKAVEAGFAAAGGATLDGYRAAFDEAWAASEAR